MIQAAPRRALVVDADPFFASSLAAEFRADGFEFEAVSTVAAALASVEASPPALVVLDLALPDNAALELLRKWKVDAPSLVVILVSHTASLTLVVEAMKAGVLRFLAKPVAYRQILAALDSADTSTADDTPNHRLGAAALQAHGVDRFFAISPGLLAISGFDGYFKMLNPAWTKLLGYSIDELCERPYLDLIHPEDRDKARDEALEIRNGHTVFRFKNRYRSKDGNYRWLEWDATPSAEHQVVYAAVRDVTKSVDLELRLRRSNERLVSIIASREVLLHESSEKNNALEELGRAKDEVSAMLVHDLKNPLSVILSNYEYLVEDFEGSAECLEALRDSQGAGRRMLRLLENLVDVERIEGGTMEVNAKSVELGPLFEALIEQRRTLARARDVSIELVPGTRISAMIDADLLMRIVENIFDNAYRYTPRGGHIEVELRVTSSGTEIRIGNSGTAIAPAEQSALFDKYRRETTATDGRMNLGLGLYFCRLATQAQGGTIWIEGTERLPTIFGIRLPARAATPEQQEERAP